MRAIRMISGIGCTAYGIGAGPAKGGWFRETDGVARYKVIAGDNLSTLALKYLGAGKRYPEIIEAQPEPRKTQLKKNPNLILAGEILWMPTEAANKALSLGLLAPPPKAPAPAPAPAPKAPAPPPVVVRPPAQTAPPPPVVVVRPPVKPSPAPSAPQSSLATPRVNTSPTPGFVPSFVKPAQASTGPEPTIPRAPIDSSGRPANERPENPEAPREPASPGLPSSATASSATPAPSASRSPITRPPALPDEEPSTPPTTTSVPVVRPTNDEPNIPLILLGGLSLVGIGWAVMRGKRR